MYYRYSLAFEPERTTALCTGGNLHILLAIKGGDLHLRAQCSVGVADRQIVENIGALALEILVGLDVERDKEVPRGATSWRRLPLSGYPDIDAVIYAGGDIHRHAANIPNAPLSLATVTGSRDDTTLAPAAVADHYIYKLAENRLLHAANLTSTLTGGAAC